MSHVEAHGVKVDTSDLDGKGLEELSLAKQQSERAVSESLLNCMTSQSLLEGAMEGVQNALDQHRRSLARLSGINIMIQTAKDLQERKGQILEVGVVIDSEDEHCGLLDRSED